MPDGGTLFLFDMLELRPSATGEGCAHPVGPRRAPRPRVRAARPPSTTRQVLGEIRNQVVEFAGEQRQRLRQLDRGLACQERALAQLLEVVEPLLRRITNIERALNLAEQPKAPRPSRRDPGGDQ